MSGEPKASVFKVSVGSSKTSAMLVRLNTGDHNLNYPRRENLSAQKTEGLERFPIHELAAIAAYWHVTQHKLRVGSVSQRNEFI
jgi:hypothetical protein